MMIQSAVSLRKKMAATFLFLEIEEEGSYFIFLQTVSLKKK